MFFFFLNNFEIILLSLLVHFFSFFFLFTNTFLKDVHTHQLLVPFAPLKNKCLTKQQLDHLSCSIYGKKNGIITYSSYIIWYDKTIKDKKIGYIYWIMSTVTWIVHILMKFVCFITVKKNIYISTECVSVCVQNECVQYQQMGPHSDTILINAQVHHYIHHTLYIHHTFSITGMKIHLVKYGK